MQLNLSHYLALLEINEFSNEKRQESETGTRQMSLKSTKLETRLKGNSTEGSLESGVCRIYRIQDTGWHVLAQSANKAPRPRASHVNILTVS